MSIGAIIRQRREEMGLTQDQVAAQVGISKPYLSNIETCKAKNPPTDGKLRALERCLKFDPGTLVKMAHKARTPVDIREEYELMEAEYRKLRGMLEGLLARSPQGDLASLDLQALSAELGTGSNVKAISAGIAMPIINRIAAGYPNHFTDLDYPPSVADEYIRCPDVHDPQAFAAYVSGDSMEPLYREGDIVVFSPNTDVRSGDDCFIRFEGDGGTTFKRSYQDDPGAIRLQPLNNKYPSQVYRTEQVTGLWPAVVRIERLRR